MALSATTEWDVRTTGNDANGGGFDTASAGVDGSQGAVVFAYSDLVISGATNHLSSVARAFVANDIGNIINITAGTNFTTGRYQVLSVLAGVATMDRVVGTLAASGGSGNLGGSLLNVDLVTKVTPIFVGGNVLHIQTGTYTRTTSWVIDTGAASGNLSIIGYAVTHNDGGAKPLITTATNSIKLVAAGSGLYTFNNLSFSNTASVRADGIWFAGTTSTPGIAVFNCTFDGFVVALNGDNGAGSAAGFNIFNTEIKNCTSDAIRYFFQIRMEGCYVHNNTGDGLHASGSTNSLCYVSDSIITANGGVGIGFTTVACALYGNTIANNTSDGIGNGNSSAHLTAYNNIIYGNGGWGINAAAGATASTVFFLNTYNAFGGPNVSGDVRNTYNQFNKKILTASPFTNSAGGDYSLNATAGGGVICKGAAFPGIFPGATSTGIMDIGAVQSGSGGSTTTPITVAVPD